MGNFEKLSVLVIVVIIVMILAVAVVEWTSGPSEGQAGGEAVAEAGAGGASTPPADARLLAGPAPATDERTGDKGGSKGGGNTWSELIKQLTPKADRGRGPEAKGPEAKGPEAKGPEAGAGEVKPGETPPGGAKPGAQDVAETTHVVAAGETLGEIAKKYYGRSSLWTTIRDANPGVTPETLRVKQTLKIPAMKGVAPSGPTLADLGPAGTRPVPGKEYTVRAHDTWERISQAAYNTSARWPEIYLRNINRVRDQKDLPPGKVLLIPR